jgi:hypothetical protein
MTGRSEVQETRRGFVSRWLRGKQAEREAREFTGSCPIREHTGDGAYVGRCEFATYDGFCPRHGALEDYPTRDDREVRVEDRRHG